MIINLGLLVVVALVAACGMYLILERSLVKMLLGLLLVGNAVNLLILTVAGAVGNPPIMGRTSDNRHNDSDALAQGMVLTAIVITMGIAAFGLSLAYRLFVINTDDEITDDPEDVKVRERALTDAPDRDRSDNRFGEDTRGGDLFDDDGNPITPAELTRRRRAHLSADMLPASEETPAAQTPTAETGDDTITDAAGTPDPTTEDRS